MFHTLITHTDLGPIPGILFSWTLLFKATVMTTTITTTIHTNKPNPGRDTVLTGTRRLSMKDIFKSLLVLVTSYVLAFHLALTVLWSYDAPGTQILSLRIGTTVLILCKLISHIISSFQSGNHQQKRGNGIFYMVMNKYRWLCNSQSIPKWNLLL